MLSSDGADRAGQDQAPTSAIPEADKNVCPTLSKQLSVIGNHSPHIALCAIISGDTFYLCDPLERACTNGYLTNLWQQTTPACRD